MTVAKKLNLALIALLIGVTLPVSAAQIFSTSAAWRYFKGRSEASTPDRTAWRRLPFDDSSWTIGNAPFYYGEALTGTLLNDMQNGYTCVFMRRTFVVDDLADVGGLRLVSNCDDGFIAWINGVEVARTNMPAGTPPYTGTAASAVEPVTVTHVLSDPSQYLVLGTNVIAIQAFNSSLSGSTDFAMAAGLSSTAPDFVPPTIASIDPAPGALNALTQITVIFSEPVSGVNASDLLINGVAAASLDGGSETYTFSFPQPAYGNVQITWAASHGIADFATPPNGLDRTAPGATWQYNLVDNIAPTIVTTIPFPNVTVRSLTQVQVLFSEPVMGVNAGDLLINGSPVAGMTAISPSEYVFQFSQPTVGTVNVEWAAGHNIQDLAAAPNPFAGPAAAGWFYLLDPNAPVAAVRINEINAANVSGLRDEDNETQDWVELYNTGTTAVSLAGWSLTDDEDEPDKWVFPNVAIAARGYLIVFCSGKDRKPVTPGSRLHTNFGLDPNGEYLALYNAEVPRQAVSVFSPYPNQRNNYSYGYDAADQLRYFQTPTAGANNGSSSIAGIVADTQFSQTRGFQTEAFSLVITSATPGVTIRYTLNGIEPTATTGSIYSGPIQITNTTVIRAAAFKTGSLPSDVDCQTYLFLDDVIRQSPASASAAGWPTSWSPNVTDYGMDPDVVNNALYRDTLKEDLKAIPTFSIVMALTDLFGGNGIYSNPGGDTIQWERRASIELIYPDGAEGFQINCGIRIRGGFSRSTDNPKHAFRFFFRQEYGQPKLDYPFFGPTGAQSFDKLDMRTMQNYSWAFQGDSRMMCLRDVLARDQQFAMSGNATRGNFFHLYINGQYWGLFNSEERPEAAFGESYYGGRAEDYDTVKVDPDLGYNIEATDGTLNAWERLWRIATNGFTGDSNYFRIQGLNVDGTANPAYENLLDVDNTIDYMLVILYGGNLDAPISNFLGNTSPNNWYGIRNRTGLYGGFRFFAHDSEHTLLDLNADRTGPYPAGDPTGSGGGFPKSNPQYLWQRLQANAEFKMRVTDRVQKHLFDGGALSVAGARALLHTRSNEINRAIVAESARWGDAKVGVPFTRATWLSAMSSVNNFINGRTAVLLNQLRADGLFPNVNAPSFSRQGGFVPAGFNLYLTNNNAGGAIYYTTDGKDPRVRGGDIAPTAMAYTAGTPIAVNGAVAIRMRLRTGTTWSGLVEAQFYTAQDFGALVVTEIMYHPPDLGVTGGSAFEFLEFKNTGSNSLDLSGLFFSEGINFTFTNGTGLAAGAFFVLASSPAQFASKYPGRTANGAYTGNLNNGGERFILTHPLGGQVLSVEYKDSGRWPVTPDGFGYSLVSRNANANPEPSNPKSWRASTDSGGSPGAEDPAAVVGAVVINEILTHTDLPQVDAIELFNPSAVAVDLGGWFLTDDATMPQKFRIPEDTIIAAEGYMVFTEADFNPTPGTNNSFTLSSTGEEVYLLSGDGNTNLTGYSHGFGFGAAANGVSFGRHLTSTGEEEYPAQTAVTLQAANAGPVVGPVVVRQIMYHPPDLPNGLDNQDDEYIELLNGTGQAVPLFDAQFPTNRWRVRGGIDFDFPPNTTLAAGSSLLLLSFDPANATKRAAFLAKYGDLASLAMFGPYDGKLDNSSDTIGLYRPDAPDLGEVPYILVEEVRYEDVAPWPPAADGAGASLQRLNHSAFGNDAINWRGVAPLQIITPPQTLTVHPDTNVTLSVLAAGTGTLRYQWRRDGLALTGETNATLEIASVQPIHDGSYTVVVADNTGSIISSPGVLTVLLAPTIIRHPASQSVIQGGTAVLSVEVTGNMPLGFRWRRAGATVNFQVLNQRTCFLVVTNLQSSVNYTVVVTNAANRTGVLSANASLTVIPDTDQDGLPDEWEMAHGLDKDSAADAGVDADGDAMTNGEEYTAGTNPQDPQSYLKVNMLAPHEPGGAIISFNAASNKTYRVEFCDAVNAATWQHLVDVVASLTNRTVMLTNTAPEASLRFYRLVTPRVL